MKTKKPITAMMLALMLAAPNLMAADAKVELEKSVAALDKADLKPDGHTKVLEGISKDTGVPVKTLQEQREKTKLGYGGLFIANALAKATGKTFDEIVALHKDGKGWGQIAKENNVKLGPIVSQAKRAEKAVDHAKNDDKVAGGGKPDGVGKPASAGQPAGGGNRGGRGK